MPCWRYRPVLVMYFQVLEGQMSEYIGMCREAGAMEAEHRGPPTERLRHEHQVRRRGRALELTTLA